MIKQVIYKSPEWYELRKTHIGASDAGAVVGVNNYMSNVDLWELKTGLKQPKDLSGNELVNYGINAEEHLAKLFELDFPQYEFISTKDIVIINDEYDFIMCSPDGLLKDKRTGEKGFYECKTTTEKDGKAKKEWAVDHIPDNYFCQCLHTFLADKTLSFGIIAVQIKHITENGENCYKETLHRKIYRKEVEEDIEILRNLELKFWENVKNKERPPYKLII